MGGADIIPGVSGGTVALILGIYERLITAISHIDIQFLRLLGKKKIRAALDHIDFFFLASLGLGIGIGIVGLASLMHYLLEHQLQHTFATFTGLILASTLIVARMVKPWNPPSVIGMVGGAVFAWWLVNLPFLEQPPESLAYLFFCGMIAICAMILPGISGSFILLILGKYIYVTGMIKGFTKGEISKDAIMAVATFAAGAVTGLIGFSKILRWLLARAHSMTMAVLAGFMLGSLRKLWPFKHDTNPEITEFKHKVFENITPSFADSSTWMSIGLCVLGFVFIVVLDRVSSRGQASPHSRA